VLFKKPDSEEHIEYFLGLLNSKLLEFRFKGIAKLKGGGYMNTFGIASQRFRFGGLILANVLRRNCMTESSNLLNK
jgi:hypothetical protein